jgi:tRNA(Ile)-lysidine synthetase-like protein
VKAELSRDTREPRRIPLGGGIELVLDESRLRVAFPAAEYCLEWYWQDTPRIDVPGTDVTLSARVIGPDELTDARLRSSRNDVAYFPADAFPGPLTLRSWCPGDRMVPFGHASAKKVKDLFSGAGIPADRRYRHPLVSAGEEVIWVAGVRRSAAYPVSLEADGQFLELSLL